MKYTVVIGSTERGLLYKNKQFVKVLTSGTYRLLNIWNEYTVETIDIIKMPELKGASARILLNESATELEKYFVKVSTSSREVAIVYKDAEAYTIVDPGTTRLFWRGFAEIRSKSFDISERYEIEKEVMKDLSRIAYEQQVLIARVPEQNKGLLLEGGVIVRELTPGTYGFWRAQRELSVSILDTRLTSFEVSGQEMLTKDKVSLRINLAVSYRLTDVMTAIRALTDIYAEVYRTAQLALRQAVGEKTLDELLESKEALNRVLAQDMTTSLNAMGVEVSRVGVKDIILPGDMRTLFNQVVEAEKAAQAQNIRRREEVAATRSLLNTAKMMENNPVLLRLKELEAVERISEKVEKLNVYDGLKGVMNGLVTLQE